MWQWHWLTEKGRSNTARRNHCFHASVQESWAKNTPSVTSCLNRYFTARLNSLSGHFCHYIGSFWLIDRFFCFCFYTVLFSAVGQTLVAYDSKWVTVVFHSVWAKFNVHKKKVDVWPNETAYIYICWSIDHRCYGPNKYSSQHKHSGLLTDIWDLFWFYQNLWMCDSLVVFVILCSIKTLSSILVD